MTDTYQPGLTISNAVVSAWAKSDEKTGDSMSLVQHCVDAALVAKRFWVDWTAPSARRVVTDWLSSAGCKEVAEPHAFAHKIATFVAGTHDVGKISPSFACQASKLAEAMKQHGFKFPLLNRRERQSAHHSLVSATAFQVWLAKAVPGAKASKVHTLSCILGGHHGKFPTMMQLDKAKPGMRTTGLDPIWQQGREELCEMARQLAGLSDDELAWLATHGLDQPSQVVLTAFVIACDWIASNVDLFPYHDERSQEDRVTAGLAALNLPAQWHPNPPDDDDELFATRFELAPGAKLRPVQAEAMRQARAIDAPVLLLIEAPTGEGKTEAAFGAAEILAQKFGCSGVIVALPTRATTNAMFSRTLDWLATAVGKDRATIALAHGSAQFNDDLAALPKVEIRKVYDEDSGSGDDASGVVAHSWLTGRKKSILSDFVVGTIDQVLMAGLSTKHVVLRHLGLASKVVILDEVHASDEYMQVYLEDVLTWLGALQVPVIALSATLPPQRRERLLAAYRSGASLAGKPKAVVSTKSHEVEGYPLISSTASEPVVCQASGRSRSAKLEYLPSEPKAISDKALQLCANGGVVAVIRNTVAHAQETFAELEPVLGDDVVLLHSRFVAIDRLSLEQQLVDALGPRGRRPHRLVVVATQVVEQSLDVDFDAMISDIAPVDALIQRMGRLHRHDRGDARPDNLREAQFFVSGVQRVPGAAPVLDSGSAAVYGQALLLRAVTCLDEHIAADPIFVSPDDVPGIVKRAYDPALTPPQGWEDAWEVAERDRQAKIASQHIRAESGSVAEPQQGAYALFGWADVEAASKAAAESVRDISDSIEVIVVVRDRSGRIKTLPWLDEYGDEPVDMPFGLAPELAKATARCTVSLQSWLARGSLGDFIVEELESDYLEGWQESPWLKRELPLVLAEDLRKQVGEYVFSYDRRTGLSVEKGML